MECVFKLALQTWSHRVLHCARTQSRRSGSAKCNEPNAIKKSVDVHLCKTAYSFSRISYALLMRSFRAERSLVLWPTWNCMSLHDQRSRSFCVRYDFWMTANGMYSICMTCQTSSPITYTQSTHKQIGAIQTIHKITCKRCVKIAISVPRMELLR